MTVWAMAVVTVVVVLAPVVLLAVFHGDDVADSRGRRWSRRWRVGSIAGTPSSHSSQQQ